jgi:ATP-dependent Clp protease protease subunit
MSNYLKLILLGSLPLFIAGCADTYNITPVEYQTVYVSSEKTETVVNKKIVNQTTSAKKQVIINFVGKITQKKTNDLTSFIHKQMNEGVNEFIINISSSGGDSDAAISAYQYLKQLPVSITTYNIGNVQSSAALIYCSGQKRYALPYSFFMLHGSSTRYAEGISLTEMEALLKLGKIHWQAFVEIMGTCSNLSKAELERYFSSADEQYLTAEEAKKIDLVDEIAAPQFAKTATLFNITDQ